MKIDWGKKLFLLLIRGTFLVFPFQKQLTAHSALYVHIICYLQSAGFIICRAGQKHLYFFISSVQIFLAPLCMLKTCIFSLWMQIPPPPPLSISYNLQGREIPSSSFAQLKRSETFSCFSLLFFVCLSDFHHHFRSKMMIFGKDEEDAGKIKKLLKLCLKREKRQLIIIIDSVDFNRKINAFFS